MTLNLPTWARIALIIAVVLAALWVTCTGLAMCLLAGMDDPKPVDFADPADVEKLARIVMEPDDDAPWLCLNGRCKHCYPNVIQFHAGGAQ